MTAEDSTRQLTQTISSIRAAVHASQPARGSVSIDSTPADPGTIARLQSAIEKIRDSILRDFQERQRPRYARLLRALEQSGVPLAGLSVCGMSTDENRQTQLLRYFLDPHEPHGLGTAVISAVFDPELGGDKLSSDQCQWDRAKVEAEYYLGSVMAGRKPLGCVVDIFVETPGTVALVEHKIRSPESGSISGGEVTQLRRYSKAFEANHPHRGHKRLLKIFLTPDGRSPKEDREWSPMTHRTLVSRLLPLLTKTQFSDIARHNLRCLLWELVSGPLAFDETIRRKLCAYIRQALDEPSRYLLLRRWAKEQRVDLNALLSTLE